MDNQERKGLSLNDVTRFGGKTDSPSPRCHISSQISEHPSKMTSHAHDPPGQYNAKVPLPQKIAKFCFMVVLLTKVN